MTWRPIDRRKSAATRATGASARRAALFVATLLAALVWSGAAASGVALAQEDSGGDGSGGGMGEFSCDMAPEAVGQLIGAAPVPGSGIAGFSTETVGERILNQRCGSDGGGGSGDGGGDGGGGGSDSGSEGGGGSSDGEEPGGLAGMALDVLKAITGFAYDWSFGALGEKMSSSSNIGAQLLALPDPSSSGEIVEKYDQVTETMRPLLLVAILVVALALGLGSQHVGISRAGLETLPRIAGVAMALAFLPELMGMLSTLGEDLTAALLPGGEQIRGATSALTASVLSNLALGGFLNVILAIVGIVVVLFVIVVAILKNVFFILLFVIAPFALLGSLIPGLQNFAWAWLKGVLVLAAIPALWAGEVWLGAWLVESPQFLFGLGEGSGGLFNLLTGGTMPTIVAILVLYVMYKTPFAAMSWAFASYDPKRGGGIASAGKFLASVVAATAIRQGMGAIAGGRSGGQGGVPEGPKGSVRETLTKDTKYSKDKEGNDVQNTVISHRREYSRQDSMDPNDFPSPTPPTGHGATDSGAQPNGYPEGLRGGEGGQLGGVGGQLARSNSNAPTMVQDENGNMQVFYPSDQQPFRNRSRKEDD